MELLDAAKLLGISVPIFAAVVAVCRYFYNRGKKAALRNKAMNALENRYRLIYAPLRAMLLGSLYHPRRLSQNRANFEICTQHLKYGKIEKYGDIRPNTWGNL